MSGDKEEPPVEILSAWNTATVGIAILLAIAAVVIPYAAYIFAAGL